MSVLAACSNGVCSWSEQRCSSDGTPQMCQLTADSCGDDLFCFSGSTPYWENQTACSNGSSCVVVAGNAVCSMTKSPAPSCADGGSICFGNDVAECTGGYPVFVQDCVGLTCKQESTGFDYKRANSEGIAFVGNLNCAYCSNGLELPNAGCAAGQTNTCANGSVFGCSCADRRSSPSTLCADAGETDDNDGGDAGDGGASPTCVSVQRPGSTEVGYIDSFCAFSSQPDPQCGGKIENAFCGSNGFEVSCWDGFAVPGGSIPCR